MKLSHTVKQTPFVNSEPSRSQTRTELEEIEAEAARAQRIAALVAARKAMLRKEDQGAICDIDTAFL